MGCGRSRSSEEQPTQAASIASDSNFKPDAVHSPSSQQWLKWVDDEREFDRQEAIAEAERARIEQQEAQLAFVVPQARKAKSVPPEVGSISVC